MNRKKPLFPPVWAPELPDAICVTPDQWFSAWDDAAKTAFATAGDAPQKAIIVEEYMLSNIRAALRSKWLSEERSVRIFRARDLIVRRYAKVLTEYIPRSNRYRLPATRARAASNYRDQLMSDRHFKALWKRVLKYRQNKSWPTSGSRPRVLVRNAVLHFHSDLQFRDIYNRLIKVPDRKTISFETFIEIVVKASNPAAAATEVTAKQFMVSSRTLETLWANPSVMADAL